MDLDVAVIGGGVAGAYCAWRLQSEFGDRLRIQLFEYSDRIGGRLYSVSLPGMPHVKGELGGMRYIPDQHVLVARLVEHLGLQTKDFPMGAAPPIGANCNLFYLRGKHLRLHELADPGKVPYNLAWSERGMGPTNLQVQVMNNLCPGFGNLSLCDQMKVRVFGKPIWQFGFWDLMFRVLSNEGYQFMRDAGGYDANVANANAVTQLPATEYSDTTQFLTLRDGYDELPKTLAYRFDREVPGGIPAGHRVQFNARLEEITSGTGEYRYNLRFRRTATRSAQTRNTDDGFHVRAKKIVLALPRRSLELIKSDLFQDHWLKRNLPSVLIQSAFKLLMAYEYPWWRALGLVSGRSVTDLPIRQVYYFGTEGEQPNGLPFGNSLLMASYNDISTVPFWKGLEEGPPYQGYAPACLDNPKGRVIPVTEYPATEEMVAVASRQIAAVHALPEIPLPYSAVYHTWNEDPYGGGWHEWKAGYRIDKIMWQMRKPIDDQDVFIVGEAYSFDQGWVKGSLDTAESMLQEFFSLQAPVWLDPKYALMPTPPSGCKDAEGCLSQPWRDVLPTLTPSCLDKVKVQ